VNVTLRYFLIRNLVFKHICRTEALCYMVNVISAVCLGHMVQDEVSPSTVVFPGIAWCDHHDVYVNAVSERSHCRAWLQTAMVVHPSAKEYLAGKM
jgi:hypothetical protein